MLYTENYVALLDMYKVLLTVGDKLVRGQVWSLQSKL